MTLPAVQVSSLCARIDEEALLQQRLSLVVDGGVLRVSEAALRRVLPPEAPVLLDKLTPFGLVLRVEHELTTILAEVRLFASPTGGLGLDLTAVRTDLLSLPASLVTALLSEFLPAQPWLRRGPGTRWEVDLAGMLRPYGVELPPLAGVRTGAGVVELEFARARAKEERQVEPRAVGPPGRLFLCPDPGCEGIIHAGDPACKRCSLPLRYCPECESPASRTAAACSGPERHPLPREEGWPVAGGSPSRSGALRHDLVPRGTLTWRHAPASSPPVEWSSPVIAYGMVYVAGVRPGKDPRLAALDLRAGALLWEKSLASEGAPGPGGLCVGDGRIYLSTRNGSLLALDAARGTERWAARLPHPTPAGCLAAGTGLFVGTARADARGGHLVALWAEDGEKVWSLELDAGVEASPAACDGRLYVCAADQRLYAVTARTGEIEWQRETGGPCAGGPVAAEGLVLVATAGGELLALDAGTGEARWREALPGPAKASPSVHRGRIYCAAADGSLSLFSVTGERLASAAAGKKIPFSPMAASNGALLGAEDGSLLFWDGAGAAVPVFQPEAGRRLGGSLAAAGRRVVLAAGGTVYAIDVEPGAPAPM